MRFGFSQDRLMHLSQSWQKGQITALILHTQVEMFNRQFCSKWFCSGASIFLSWHTCLRPGVTARPRRWIPTSSAATASRPAGSTARPDTWWRTATAEWSTCPVGNTSHALHVLRGLISWLLSRNWCSFLASKTTWTLWIRKKVSNFRVVMWLQQAAPSN